MSLTALLLFATHPFEDTKQNPADDASRGLLGDVFLNNQRWLNGPEFLVQSKETWPRRPIGSETISADDPEVKREKISLATRLNEDNSFLLQLSLKFSSWTKLKKIVAWLLRYQTKLQEAVIKQKTEERMESVPTEVSPITTDEVNQAEIEIVRCVQRDSFPNEIAKLQNYIFDASPSRHQRNPTRKNSPLYTLDSYLKDGVIRVGGRLRNSPIPHEAEHR